MASSLLPNAQLASRLTLLLMSASLAGCASIGPDTGSGDVNVSRADSPFAPTAKPGKTGEDPKIVGYRLMDAGEYELALKSFQRAANSEGLTTELLSAFGSVNLGLGRLGQAEALMRRATLADDATPQDWNNLGVVLMERGESAEAVQILRKAFALSNGEATEIRDNLRLALAKLEKRSYSDDQQQEYKLVRRGASDFVIRKTPG